MTTTQQTILTNAVYTFGFARGSADLSNHPVYRHGGFSHPVSEFAANARPSFKDLKIAVEESTGLRLSGNASAWMPLWSDGYVAAHVAIV